MAKFHGVAFSDGGPDLLRARAATANRILFHVLKAYTLGDSYATVLGNSVGSVACVTGDFVSTGASGATRVTTLAGKTVTLSAGTGASPDMHVALLDSVSSEVHVVNDETGNPVMVAAGVVTVPAFPILNYPQPT
jgi:hypothetical protein